MPSHTKTFLPGAILASGVALATLVQPLMAADLFSANLVVDHLQSTTLSFSRIEELQDVLTESKIRELEQIGNAYTETSQVHITLNMRGLDFTAEYVKDSTELRVQSGAIAFTQSFHGATREESERAFRDYLESNQENLLTRTLQYWVANTSIDPVAGNPNALINRMGASDFRGSATIPTLPTTQTALSSFGTSASLGRYSTQEGHTISLFSVPMEYTHQFEEDPRRQIYLSAPLTYYSVGGSKSYDASLGVSYRHPISDDWSLSPGVRLGALGSVDIGSAAAVYAFSLKSEYRLYHDDLNIRIGNMIGSYSTMDLSANNKSFNYDISNQITKNGISLEGSTATQLFGKPSSWEAAVAHTYVWGSDVFIDSYFDLIFTFGTRYSDSGDSWDALRFGLSATIGNNSYKGFGINFGYTF